MYREFFLSVAALQVTITVIKVSHFREKKKSHVKQANWLRGESKNFWIPRILNEEFSQFFD